MWCAKGAYLRIGSSQIRKKVGECLELNVEGKDRWTEPLTDGEVGADDAPAALLRGLTKC